MNPHGHGLLAGVGQGLDSSLEDHSQIYEMITMFFAGSGSC